MRIYMLNQIFHIPYILMKENKQFVAYSPALDLASCGDSVEHAKKCLRKQQNYF